jgi:hypothetical protein
MVEGMHMTGKLWLVGGGTALLALALGVFMFFGMLVGLNGYSGEQGGAILLAYALSMILTLGLSVWVSVVGAQALAARTTWSFWLLGPLSVLGGVLAAFLLMLLCAVILLMVMG